MGSAHKEDEMLSEEMGKYHKVELQEPFYLPVGRWVDEVAKLERAARAADALMDKHSCRRANEVVELEAALTDLPEGALGGYDERM